MEQHSFSHRARAEFLVYLAEVVEGEQFPEAQPKQSIEPDQETPIQEATRGFL